MASLEYVIAGWLRLRRLTVASVGAGWGRGGLCPRHLPRQGGGLGPGDLLPGGGRSGRRGGGRPWLHSGGSSPVYSVPLWALFSSVRRPKGWALVSSRVCPSGLSGALLPWSSSFWRCQTTRICGPPLSHRVAEAVLDCALTPDPVPRVFVAVGLLDLRALFESWVRLGWGRRWWRGGRMMRMPGPGGAVVMMGGRMTRMLGPELPGGFGGGRGVGRSLRFQLGWGRVRPFFVSLAWVGLEVVGLGGRGV